MYATISRDAVHIIRESALSLCVYGSVVMLGVSFWLAVLHMASGLMP